MGEGFIYLNQIVSTAHMLGKIMATFFSWLGELCAILPHCLVRSMAIVSLYLWLLKYWGLLLVYLISPT